MDGPRCAVDPNSPPASTVAAADGDACALPCEKVYYAGSILSILVQNFHHSLL